MGRAGQEVLSMIKGLKTHRAEFEHPTTDTLCGRRGWDQRRNTWRNISWPASQLRVTCRACLAVMRRWNIPNGTAVLVGNRIVPKEEARAERARLSQR